MARICLISPGHLTSNPRLVKEADALTDAGHEVTVITGWSFPPHQSEDRRFESRSWAQQQRVAFGALASLQRRFWQHLRQRLARVLVRMGAQDPAVAIRAWHLAGPDLIRAAQRIRADFYIAHYPAALPAAALAARVHGGRYSFDAEDFHLGDFPEGPSYDFQRQLLRLIEGRYLPDCMFTTAASPGIADAYADAYGISLPIVLRNMFPLAHAPEGPTPRGTAIPGPSLYWFSQTIGPDRGLECAVRSLALARCKPHLHLRGFISTVYRDQLMDLACQLGVDSRLHLHPPQSPEQMERLASKYDVGLVAETGCTPNRSIALTNKLFTYALAGIPMLLSDIPAHRALQAEAGEAVRLFRTDDQASLAKGLDDWLDAPPGKLALARQAAYRLGRERWNWEQEQQILLGQLTQLSSAIG